MSKWNHWQNHRGILTGGHFFRDGLDVDDSEKEQVALNTHHGTMGLFNNTLAKTGAEVLGMGSQWTLSLFYRMDSFSTLSHILLIIAEASGNGNKITIETPNPFPVTQEMTVSVFNPAGTVTNKLDWDLTSDFYVGDTAKRTEWIHVVVTYDADEAAADELAVYAYGVDVTSSATKTTGGSTNMTDTSRSLQLGSTGYFGFPGNIQHLALWNSVLSADEIKVLYNHGRPGNLDLQTNRDGYVSASTLIHWWRMGFNTLLDVQFEDVIDGTLDFLDNAVTVTEENTRSYTPSGSYLANFDGSTDILRATNGSSGFNLGIENEWTVALWANWNSPVGKTLFDIDSVNTKDLNRIRLHSGTGGSTTIDVTVADKNGDSVSIVLAPGSVTLNWVQVVATKLSDNTFNLYYNGILGGTIAVTADMEELGDRAISIGGDANDAANKYGGDIRSVAVWNTSMTAEEVEVIWNEGSDDIDLRRGFLGYRHASSLLHWFWCSQPAQSTEQGNDFIVDKGHSATLIDLSEDAAGIDGSNVRFANDAINSGEGSGASLIIDGTGEGMGTTGTSVLGFTNNWTIQFGFKPITLSSYGDVTILDIIGSTNANRIRVRLLGTLSGDPLVVEVWDSGGTQRKDHRFTNFFSSDRWDVATIAFFGAFSGDPMRIYRGGNALSPSSTPTNSNGTMTDTARNVAYPIAPSGADARYSDLIIWNTYLDVFSRDMTIQTACTLPKLDPRRTQGGYTAPVNLVHWWKIAADPNILGRDYAIDGVEDDMDTLPGITTLDNSAAESP